MPHAKKSSYLSTSLIVVALAAGASYFAFFRGSGEPATPAVAAQEPAAAAIKPEPVRIEPAPPPVKVAMPQVKGTLAEIQALIDDGQWRPARAAVAAAFTANLSDPERAELTKKGIEINQRLLIVQADDKDVELYEIKSGDTLDRIAGKFKTLNGVKGSIMLVNNYTEKSILQVGRKIKIPRGTWSIVADKSLFQLYACYEGAPFKAYKVAVGADQKTPATQFTVGVKTPKPSWWDPPPDLGIKKLPVPYGDPRNPLGDWWIALEHDLHRGIGIHGTNDPGSIGSKASNGCIRMLNAEVVEIAALAYKGMVATIVD